MVRGALEGRVAVITGAGRGLGRAVAEAFAGEGARVALVDVSGEELDDAAAGLRAVGVCGAGVPGGCGR